jgi:ribA/ribD-fused uncharacterized protein
MKDSIGPFIKDWKWLSNFYETEVTFEEKTYPTVEHACQAAKTTDLEERETIRQLKTPVEARRYGRKVKLRDDWAYIRLSVMKDLLKQKFVLASMLGRKLEKTGDMELIEFNARHDNYWGWCMCNECKHKTKFNRLGQLLMDVRKENRKC